jgi:hypothetical protein
LASQQRHLQQPLQRWLAALCRHILQRRLALLLRLCCEVEAGLLEHAVQR